MAKISVITPTKNRLGPLERAMESVAAQAGVHVEHVIIGDNCPQLDDPGVVERLRDRFPRAMITNLRQPAESYRPARTSAIRNLGVSRSTDADYVAHLDDDNAFEPDHLRRLLEVIRAVPGAPVAYSWRKLFDADGGDYDLAGGNPWIRDIEESRRSYSELLDLGVFREGSSVMRDQPLGRNGEKLYLIDTSELLVTRQFQLAVPFRTSYTAKERAGGLCEDRAFCMDVLTGGHQIVCSRRATLRYYMGGYSNA